MEFIGADRAAQLVTMNDAIIALRTAVTGAFDPANDPVRLTAPLSHGEFLFMPSELGDYICAKVLTLTPDNATRDLPRIQGLTMLLDSNTRETLAVIDGPALTAVRTPAVSIAGIADVLRARCAAGVRIALVGNGVQAVPHVLATLAVVPVEHVSVIVREPGRGRAVVAELRARSIDAVEVAAGDRAAALRDAGLIITATASTQPLFDSAEVPDHAIVVAMGSHSPQARELPGELLSRATIIVESHHSAAAEAGDLLLAAQEGQCDPAAAHTFKEVVESHGDVIPNDGPVVFKTTGMSWEDAAIAALIWEAHLAQEQAAQKQAALGSEGNQ